MLLNYRKHFVIFAILLIILGTGQLVFAQQVDGPTITIPVVFHVVGTQISNPSIFAQEVDILNEAFNPSPETLSKLPVNIRNRVGRTKIRFRLVDQEPNGNPSQGYTLSLQDNPREHKVSQFRKTLNLPTKSKK